MIFRCVRKAFAYSLLFAFRQPTTVQEAPEIAPRRPRGPQESPKTAQDSPKRVQEAPLTA